MSILVAMAITRWWTRVYTFGLPAELRAIRRAEIESDLWESLHDPDNAHPQILPRLAGGVVDDVCWRANYLPDESRMVWLTIATGALLLAAVWGWLARPAIMAMLLEAIWFYPLVGAAPRLLIPVFFCLHRVLVF